MLCDICKEQIATIHYTEVLPNSEPKKLALCESCAKQKKLLVPSQFSVADILKGLTQAVQAEEEDIKTSCPRCRLTFARFRKGGRLGCATCYEAFKPNLQAILEEIHRNKQHTGKVPRSVTKEPGKAAQLTRLHQRLKEAIDKEEFEDAAVLRDRIQALEDEIKRGKKTRK
jgi:protein arginine kinase activator